MDQNLSADTISVIVSAIVASVTQRGTRCLQNWKQSVSSMQSFAHSRVFRLALRCRAQKVQNTISRVGDSQKGV